MLITEVEFDLPPASSGLDLKQPVHKRAKGLHVSDVLRDIENRVIKPGLRPRDSELSKDELRRMGNYREGGFILELIIETLLAGDVRGASSLLLRKLVSHFFKQRMIARRRVRAQKEITVDLLPGTPDAMDMANWVLEEYKATWRASWRVQDMEQEFWYWFRQIQCYMYMVSRRFKKKCLHARLFVFFINGDYRESGPQIRQFNIECSWHELEENWQMMQRHFHRMRRA